MVGLPTMFSMVMMALFGHSPGNPVGFPYVLHRLGKLVAEQQVRDGGVRRAQLSVSRVQIRPDQLPPSVRDLSTAVGNQGKCIE